VQACRELQHGDKRAAEDALMGLRKSPEAIPCMQRILQMSTVDTFVQFQAALVLRHSAVEQWEAMNPQSRIGLRKNVFETIVNRGEAMQRVVRMQLLQALAVMWKRGWLDKDGSVVNAKTELFEQISVLLQTGSGRFRNIIGLRLLVALVHEFSSSKASEIGLSFSYHRKCHESFEMAGLRDSFMLASNVLFEMTKLPQLDQLAAEVISSSLALLEACLAWDFRCGSASSDASKTFRSESSIATSEHVTLKIDEIIKPGPSWRMVLVGGNLIQTLFQLYDGTRASSIGNTGSGAENVSHQIRQLLVFLGSVNGDIFESDEMRANYVNLLISGSLFGVVASPMVPMNVAAGLVQTFESSKADSKEALCAAGAAEYLDMCNLMAHLMSNFGSDVFACLDSNSSRFMEIVDAMFWFSKSLLEGAAVCVSRPIQQNVEHDEDDDIDHSWLMEGFGHMLDIWVAFCKWASKKSQQGLPSNQAKQVAFVREKSTELYSFYVEKRLIIARASMEREEHEVFNEVEMFEDESVLDDHLISISFLGRADATRGVAGMTRVFRITQEKLQSCMNMPISDASTSECSKLSEELYWVVLLSAYLLADSSEGECAMIPLPILQVSASFCEHQNTKNDQTAMQDPVLQLAWCIIRMVEFDSERVNASQGADSRLSPLLSEKLLSALARIVQTYLLPDEGLYSGPHIRVRCGLPFSVSTCFGQNDTGMQVTDFLVKSASIYLSNWGIEGGVNTQALSLLRAVVSNPKASSILLRLPNWGLLIDAHVRSVKDTHWSPLGGLTAEGQGTLLEILLKSYEQSRDAAARDLQTSQDGFTGLVMPVQQRLAMFKDHMVKDSQELVSRSSTNPKFKISKTVSDPQWMNDFQRLFHLYIGVCKAAQSGPLAQWCRNIVIQSLVGAWSDLANASLVYMSVLGISASASSTFRMVISCTLELLRVFTDDQLALTPETQLLPVMQACDKILQVYTEYYKLIMSSNNPALGRDDVWAQDIVKLLRMLTAIADRDVLDFSEEETSEQGFSAGGLDAGQIVLHGINLVFPLVTKEMMQYPGLAEQFFTLLTTVINTYPQKIATLDPAMFTATVSALETGMLDHRPVVSRKSFEALFRLAEFHAVEIGSRPPRPGLGKNVFGGGGSSVMLHLLQQVLTFVIFQSFDASLLDPAANALFALIACEQSNFASMIEQVIRSQPDEGLQQRLSSAFTGLIQNNGVQLKFDRVNRRKFQQNLLLFVNEVRGFMRKK